MTEQKKFSESDLTEALEAIGPKLKRKVRAYLIGGCAMTFLGAKLATKDIDTVLTSTADIKELSAAMQAAGFRPVKKPSKEYDTLGTWMILEDSKGMRFDMFDRQVCRALEMDKDMTSRAAFYRSFGNLEVYLTSAEDILLFKGSPTGGQTLTTCAYLQNAASTGRSSKGSACRRSKADFGPTSSE